MPDDKDRQVHKIRQLLTLAARPDTPDGEREAAFVRVGMLMLKYEIQEADLKQAEQGQREQIILYRHPVTGKGGHGKERAWALGDVAEGMGCATCYRANDAGNGVRWVQIVGPASTIQNLKILLPAVLLQMEHGAAKAARERAKELPSWLRQHERSRETATVRRSFMRGFGAAVKAKLEAGRAEYAQDLRSKAATGDQRSAGQELVLVDRSARALAEFQKIFPKLGNARAPRHFDAAAYRDGVDAGTRADLGTGHLPSPSRRELE